MVTLDYRDVRPIYAQICDGLREQIRSGILPAGERLPSVRELATQLTINPNTIQRSYRQLESEGFIASVPGKGSFVCAIARQDVDKALWTALDTAVAQLLSEGIDTAQIIRHIQEGGNIHT